MTGVAPSRSAARRSPSKATAADGITAPGAEPAPGTAADAPKDPVPAKDPKAAENDYSPDFKPEPEPKPETDADIDTQGG